MIMGTSERFSASTLNLHSTFDGSWDAGDRVLDGEANELQDYHINAKFSRDYLAHDREQRKSVAAR